MTTFERLYKARVASGRFECIGLDPDLGQLPDGLPGDTNAERVYYFLTRIIDQTHHLTAAYKPQYAFFALLDEDCHSVLRRVIAYIRKVDPTIPIIIDFKRADIGMTNKGYVHEAFDLFGADAATVHPYLGKEAMRPFLIQEDKLIIVLCRTSNPGAGELQDVTCLPYRHRLDGMIYSTLEEAARERGTSKENSANYKRMPLTLYQFVAYRVTQNWNEHGNCAVVVGATYADKELKEIREIVGNLMILIPGIGTQGGDLAASIRHGRSDKGWDIILNNASAILFAYAKLKDGDRLKYTSTQFAEAAAEAAETMHRAIVAALLREDLEQLSAVITGKHLVYQSGKHGDAYINYDPAFPHLRLVRSHCLQLVRPYLGQFDTIVAPATGGIVLGTLCGEVAIEQGCDVEVTWADKNRNGNFVFERAGAVKAITGKRVLVVDDTMTNANERGSVYKLCRLIEKHGGTVIGVSLICNRCNGTAEQLRVVRLEALMELDFTSFEAEECPYCKDGRSIVTDVGHGAEFRKENSDYPGGFIELLS